MGAKPNKIEKQPSKKKSADSNKTAQAKVQTISTGHMAEFETDSESEQESNQEQLDIDVLLNMESNKE